MINRLKRWWYDTDNHIRTLDRLIERHPKLQHLKDLTCYCGKQLELKQIYDTLDEDKFQISVVESQTCKCGMRVIKHIHKIW